MGTGAAAGWTLVEVVTLALVAAIAAVLWQLGVTEAGAHAVVRLTARSSAVLFALALAAPGLPRLLRSGRWIASRERYLLAALVVSHALHALAIVAHRSLAVAPRPEPWFVLVGGGLGYAMIGLLAVTSFGVPASAAPRALRTLRAAAWAIVWLVFAAAYTLRVLFESAAFLPLALMLYGALAVRIAAAYSARSAAAGSTRLARRAGT
jgi:hypothetical protein